MVTHKKNKKYRNDKKNDSNNNNHNQSSTTVTIIGTPVIGDPAWTCVTFLLSAVCSVAIALCAARQDSQSRLLHLLA